MRRRGRAKGPPEDGGPAASAHRVGVMIPGHPRCLRGVWPPGPPGRRGQEAFPRRRSWIGWPGWSSGRRRATRSPGRWPLRASHAEIVTMPDSACESAPRGSSVPGSEALACSPRRRAGSMSHRGAASVPWWRTFRGPTTAPQRGEERRRRVRRPPNTRSPERDPVPDTADDSAPSPPRRAPRGRLLARAGRADVEPGCLRGDPIPLGPGVGSRGSGRRSRDRRGGRTRRPHDAPW